jgi:hypothetical protein
VAGAARLPGTHRSAAGRAAGTEEGRFAVIGAQAQQKEKPAAGLWPVAGFRCEVKLADKPGSVVGNEQRNLI